MGFSSQSSLPSLPLDWTAQPAWGFREESGTFLYEFHRVYQPARAPRDRPESAGQVLDEDWSYWVVTWPDGADGANQQSRGRWMTYGQARRLPGSKLNFAWFSNLSRMRAELPRLLHMRGEAGATRDDTPDVNWLVPRPTVVVSQNATVRELQR